LQTPSTQWAAVSAAATTALARIDRSWVEAFATARQGDTGDPQAVDTARLMPALERARLAPSALLEAEATFDEAFKDLQDQWEQLRAALRQAAMPEVGSLSEVVDHVVDRIAGAELAEMLPEIESAGMVAADNKVFRPPHLYPSFRSACDRLKEIKPDEVTTWTSEREQMSHGADPLDAGLAAQRWAARAGRAVQDLSVITECLQSTSSEVEDRLVYEIGETPEQVEAQIHTQLVRLSEMLTTLGGDS
jgi:hypothetical protein